MKLFKRLHKSLVMNHNRNSFYISERFYSYAELGQKISSIRGMIKISCDETEKHIGLITNDDLETYSAIIALWFEGKAFVPLNPEHPEKRNIGVINQAGIKTIINSTTQSFFIDYNIIDCKDLPEVSLNLEPKEIEGSELAYIFFTSGTTGVPKGVSISRDNLSGFIDSFGEFGFDINENDRFLQMFDLTFDLSVMSYLVPILNGACAYTIPKGKIKYNYIFELLDEQNITFALMVPSIIHYLRPYFEEINVPSLKYSLFCGEALPLDVTEAWSNCVPNAEILNVYGPTENTIFCTSYKYKRMESNKSNNGVLCIGKPMDGVEMVIVNNKNQLLPVKEKGELCLAGNLLSPGYWRNEEKNSEAFFSVQYKGNSTRFYKTGDLCIEDDEGDFMYLGRIDFQAQIQGYRVELSEVEFHVKAFLKDTNAIAVAFTNKLHNTEIGLFIESAKFETNDLLDYCKTNMPNYMIPTQLQFIVTFPLNVNGKIDRKRLKALIDKK